MKKQYSRHSFIPTTPHYLSTARSYAPDTRKGSSGSNICFKSQKSSESKQEKNLLTDLVPEDSKHQNPNQPQNNPEWELMVVNLPSHAKEEDLEELLSELSPSLQTKGITFPRKEENMITNEEFGYVRLYCLEDKLRLMFLSPKLCLKNQELKFKEPIPAFEMRKRMERQREQQVYVRGLNKKNGNERTLKKFFSRFGPVKNVELARHFKSGRFLGFAHIEFFKRKSVLAVLKGKEETKYMLNGKKIICKRKLLKVEIDKTRGENLIKEKYLTKSNGSKENNRSHENASSKKSNREFSKSGWNNGRENWKMKINLISEDENGFLFSSKNTPRKGSCNFHDVQKTTASKKKERGVWSQFYSQKKGKKLNLSVADSSKKLTTESPVFRFPPVPIDTSRPKALSNQHLSPEKQKEEESPISPLLRPPSPEKPTSTSFFASLNASKSKKYSFDRMSLTSISSLKGSKKNPIKLPKEGEEDYFNPFKGCNSEKLEEMIEFRKSGGKKEKSKEKEE